MDMKSSKFQKIMKRREAWHAAVHGVADGHDLATEQQQQRLEVHKRLTGLPSFWGF